MNPRSFVALGILLLLTVRAAAGEEQPSAAVEEQGPRWHARRAQEFFDAGQLNSFKKELAEAIRINPGDLGQDYQPTSERELSSETLKHGEEQVSNMLRDRPAMAAHVAPGAEIWTWAVRKFAGEDAGVLIHWDGRDPSPHEALIAPIDDGNTNLLVRDIAARSPDQKDRAFDTLWARTIYELFNAINSNQVRENADRAAAGDLTKDEYILACCTAKDRSAQRTRAFYLTFYLPWLERKGLVQSTSPEQWQCYSFLADDADRRKYWQARSHWGLYSRSFDMIRARKELDSGDYARVARRIETIQADEEGLSRLELVNLHFLRGKYALATRDVQSAIREFSAAQVLDPKTREISYALAYALEFNGQLDDSIVELTRLIENHSDWPVAYHARAIAYGRKRNWDQSMADFEKAIKLSPDDGQLYLGRGKLLVYRREFNAAWEDFSQFIKLHADRPEGYDARAKLSLKWEDGPPDGGPTAVEDATRCCELTKWQSANYLRLLSEALKSAGDDERAAEYETKAQRLDR